MGDTEGWDTDDVNEAQQQVVYINLGSFIQLCERIENSIFSIDKIVTGRYVVIDLTIFEVLLLCYLPRDGI